MSFRVKTILGVALIEAVLLAILVWNSIAILTTSVEDGLTKRAVTTSRLFAGAAKDAVISSDLATLDTLVNDLVENPDLSYVRVLDPNGEVLAQAARNIERIPATFKQDESYQDTDDGIYDTRVEISESDTVFGQVEIGFSIAPLTATVETAGRNTISIAIVEMVLVALFSFVLGIYLTRQLKQLTRASGRIAKGEFGYQLAVQGKDELAETASAFNTMSRRISSLYDQVTENEKRSRTIVDASLDAIIAIDQQGNIFEFNPAAEEIFGHRKEAVMGSNLAEIIIPERLRDAHAKGMAHYLKTGEGPVLGKRIELPALRSDGEEFPAEVSIQAETTANGSIFIAYIRDVTEQKRAEAELREAKDNAEAASAVKSEFLAMMSHEIRTPINGVIGSLSLLQDTQMNPEQEELTRTGRRSSEALLGIINDILDFSKMEAGKFILDSAPLKISDIIETVVLVVSPRAEDKGLAIQTHISQRVPDYLIGDEGRVRQILLNLVGNAVKFTDTGSVTIEVSIIEESEQDTKLRFDVIDTGIGISAENHDELFSEFTTLTPAYTQKFGGTGLGLAISKTLTDLMEGEIGFDSELEKGSRFWFSLPLRKLSPEALETVANAEKSLADFKDMTFSGTILLAEDNPANQLVTRMALEKSGLRVDIASNGVEAVAALRQRPYDLVLMDIGMPELDGIGATAQIRELPSERSKTPIIAMTAHVMQGDRSKLLAQGMDGYLAKPASREQLLTYIGEWLEPVYETAAQTDDDTAATDVAPSEDSGGQTSLNKVALVQLGEDTDVTMLPHLIDTFITTGREQVEKIVAAAEQQDFENIAAQAHALKSSSATFGAVELNALVKSIEQAGKEADSANLQETVPAMEREASIVFTLLSEYAENECTSD